VGLRARPVPDPGFGDTTDFPQIKEHYYVVHADINPTQVIPAGPGHLGLADPARARGARRLAVRRRDAARAAPEHERVPADHGPGGIGHR
jgi:putative glutathione S-transferase